MAQHNIGHFYGVVCTNPTILKDDETGKVVTTSFHILTVTSSRQYEGANEVSMPEQNQIMIRSGVPETAMRLARVRLHDIIILKGSINTRNVPKQVTCLDCQRRFNVSEAARMMEESTEDSSTASDKRKLSGMVTFITPIDFDVRETKYGDMTIDIDNKDLDEDIKKEAKLEVRKEALQFINEHREMSNEIWVLGNLCADPVQWEDGRVTAYQLGVNRKFYLRDDDPSTASDYPYIRSMGKQADNDIDALCKGSLVLVDGFVRLRKFQRESVCPYCGAHKQWLDKVLEIIPYSVQYLSGYKTGKERLDEKNAEYLAYQNRGDEE